MRYTLFFFTFLFFTHSLYSQERDTLTLLFVGDLMQHKGQIDAARTGNNYDYSECFQYVKKEIERADISIGNLEVTLGGKPYTGYPMFSAPDEYLYAIREAGFDVLLTANNHCMDRGNKGLKRTIMMLDSLRIPYLGTYNNKSERDTIYPLLIEKNGFRLVFLNYTYGTNGIEPQAPVIVNMLDKRQIEHDIRKARKMKPDAIIACVHWGDEYRSLPNKSQKDLADWMISQGVNHIIGAHPHVIQPMEMRKNYLSPDHHIVAYSLGNFISNMSAPNTDGGAILKLELTKINRIVRVKDCSYSLVWTSRPTVSGKKNYILYPETISKDSLNAEEKRKMETFFTNSRKLLNTYNKQVSEYTFD